MVQTTASDLTHLYESDETAWLDEMAELIHQGRLHDIDYPHLQEYLCDMARRDRREVKSCLITLLAHVLKWMHQPDLRSRSRRGTIVEQRQELSELVARGVLRNHAEAILTDAYVEAVERAAAETGLSTATFAAECPFTLEQLLAPMFPPE